MSAPFRVGVTRDFLSPEGTLEYGDIGLGLLDEAPDVEWEFLKERTGELTAEQVRGYDALLVLSPRVTRQTLEGADQLAIIARFGVGYDRVDVAACTDRGVILTITPDGVRRPLAVAALTYLLALSQKLLVKDRLTRAGGWDEKLHHMGMGLTGRTLGLIGVGNIGREILRLIQPLGMRHVAYDPFASAGEAASLGVELLGLESLLGAADFVVIACALTEDTYHLIDAERLALMKPTAYIVNIARGPIVDQAALAEALRGRRIQGAGLDVFEEEPVDPKDPILALDNVIVAPHGLGWTDECFRGNGLSACQSILDVAAGREPKYVVNREALASPAAQERLARYRERARLAGARQARG
jgi:D-3-phosphoglycerate dehydrogenase